MKFNFFIIPLFSLFLIQVNAQNGEELFKTTCVSCHTINKGRLVGPDLTGVYLRRESDWLISFIRSSQQMIKSGDPDAVAVFNEYNKVPMPDNNFTDQQIISIIDYIRQEDKATAETSKAGESAADSIVAADTSIAAVTDTVTMKEGTLRLGRSYFYGTTPFANGATPCMSCHNINDGSLFGGGKLAFDLTASYTKLGAAGITAILTNPPFPAMKAAIPGALTQEEIASLNSLLKASSINSVNRKPFPRGMSFFVLSFIISLFIAAIAFLLYDDRKIPEGNLLTSKKSG